MVDDADRYALGVGGAQLSRILSIDPGDVRIGVAVSDPTRTIVRPLTVLIHASRAVDAQAISDIAEEQDAAVILVGLPLDQDGRHGPQARKSQKLALSISEHSDREVVFWDESGSSQAAGKRDRMHDARSAAVILQDYLNAQGA